MTTVNEMIDLLKAQRELHGGDIEVSFGSTPTPVDFQEVLNALAECSQRLSNAVQGNLTPETAMRLMMKVNRLRANIEDNGVVFRSGLVFQNIPEVG